ncbi:Col-cuticle-N domain-containing protein [Aphelenchoides fujianensis]|nr:Col-cuticle-N domain-containing protein [Aphelenchoides fujianensis]
MSLHEDRTVKELTREAEDLRRFAFFGVSVSTVAILTAVIAIPSLYSYMQFVQSGLEDELSFCLHRTHGLWQEFTKVEDITGMHGRIKRHNSYGGGGGGYAQGGGYSGGGGGGSYAQAPRASYQQPAPVASSYQQPRYAPAPAYRPAAVQHQAQSYHQQAPVSAPVGGYGGSAGGQSQQCSCGSGRAGPPGMAEMVLTDSPAAMASPVKTPDRRRRPKTRSASTARLDLRVLQAAPGKKAPLDNPATPAKTDSLATRRLDLRDLLDLLARAERPDSLASAALTAASPPDLPPLDLPARRGPAVLPANPVSRVAAEALNPDPPDLPAMRAHLVNLAVPAVLADVDRTAALETVAAATTARLPALLPATKSAPLLGT